MTTEPSRHGLDQERSGPAGPTCSEENTCSEGQTSTTDRTPLHLRLQRARTAFPMSLKEAAKRCGVSVLDLSNIERGKTVPPPPLQDTLAALYADDTLAGEPQGDAGPTEEHTTPAEEARLARMEFRRHHPLSPEERDRMLGLLRQIGPRHPGDRTETLVSDPYGQPNSQRATFRQDRFSHRSPLTDREATEERQKITENDTAPQKKTGMIQNR